jgi:hypothetical protein
LTITTGRVEDASNVGVAMAGFAINPIAGGVLLLAAAIVGVAQIARGVRPSPRAWKRIGDPDAWRGARPQ